MCVQQILHEGGSAAGHATDDDGAGEFRHSHSLPLLGLPVPQADPPPRARLAFTPDNPAKELLTASPQIAANDDSR
jgi:hypothetical protein